MFRSNEDIVVTKISTHGGQDVFVYFVQRNPTLFEIDKIIYPTGLLSVNLFGCCVSALTTVYEIR